MIVSPSARKAPGDRHLVVHFRRPGQRRRQLLLGVILVAGVAWGLFRVGTYYGVDRVAALEQEVEKLERQLQLARVENEALHQEVVQSKQTARLDEDALHEINTTIRDLEQRNSKLQGELSFLRGIMNPGEDSTGLQVRELVLEPGSAAGRFRFSLILSQAGRHDRVTQGTVSLKVQGIQGDKEEVLGGKSLALDPERSMKFRFRYFQTLNGEFGLPEGFKPRSLWVEASTGAKGETPEKKVFPWPLEEDIHAGR